MAALTDAMAHIAIIWIDAGIPPQTVIGPILARAWIGSMIGVMVMTPVMLVHRQPPGRQTRRDLIEIGLQSLVTAGVLWLIFAELPPTACSCSICCSCREPGWRRGSACAARS